MQGNTDFTIFTNLASQDASRARADPSHDVLQMRYKRN